MKKFELENGVVHWEGAELETPFNKCEFTLHKPLIDNGNVQHVFHCDLGTITVLDRVTGFGCGERDVETGFRDPDGLFWLASGNFDIRVLALPTLGAAIKEIKMKANICRGWSTKLQKDTDL